MSSIPEEQRQSFSSSDFEDDEDYEEAKKIEFKNETPDSSPDIVAEKDKKEAPNLLMKKIVNPLIEKLNNIMRNSIVNFKRSSTIMR
jgi:hypothetical protein